MALLMPAMLFTACSNDKEITPTIDDNTAKKGYPLQVTVNVTCQDEDTPAGSSKTMRAHYNGDTKKLEFSEGDQLFVHGIDNSVGGAGLYAGTLDYVPASGQFSGTITTENSYSGTADELFAVPAVQAVLLPAGYGTYGYFSIVDNNGYDAVINYDDNKAFATSKAAAIEQFSYERVDGYSSGFPLYSWNAILNFTITGLSASTTVAVALTGPESLTITGSVTTDGSGTATFAAAVDGGTDFNALSLTVGGNEISLASGSKELVAGKVYNITRSAVPAVGHALASSAVGEVVGTDGLAYNAADRRNLPIGVTSAGVVAYKSGDNGLVLALEDKGSMGWSDAVGAGGASAYTPTVTDHSWKLPSQSEWRQMFGANGGDQTDYRGLNTILVNVGGSGFNVSKNYTNYWTSDSSGDSNAYIFSLYDGHNVWFTYNAKTAVCYVRSCFSF